MSKLQKQIHTFLDQIDKQMKESKSLSSLFVLGAPPEKTRTGLRKLGTLSKSHSFGPKI